MLYHTLFPISQPTFNPAQNASRYTQCLQFLYQSDVLNRIKGFSKVQVDNIHRLTPFQHICDLF
jgi:hypothetical protein